MYKYIFSIISTVLYKDITKQWQVLHMYKANEYKKKGKEKVEDNFGIK